MSTLPDTSSPAALSARPRAETFKVEDLVPFVLSGQIRIPSFQRGIKWDAGDALALLDSIDRGYPIGTLLLWQRPAKHEQIRHGTVVIDAPERPDALWVVDGQQRIVSLTRIFAGAGFPEEPFAAFYDLNERKFKHLARSGTPAPHDLPLTELLDSARLVDWFFAHPDVTTHRQAAIQLGKRLREYLVPAYVVTTSDERTVREIFRRANNTGKRMEDSEIFNALYGAEGPAPASLRDVARSLDDLAFGPIDEPTLLNMLLATRGTDLSKDRVPELSQQQAHQAMTDLARCARAALVFLRDDVGVPHISLLPYQPPLFALARFFHLHPEPHPRSRELLARWLWRGAITGVHNGSTEQVRQMLTAIGDDEHAAVQSLLNDVQRRPSYLSISEKVQLLALLALGPRDLRDGELVSPPPDTLSTASAYYALLRRIVPDGWGPPELSSRIFHPSMPSSELLDAIIACQAPELLASHAISPAAQRALGDDRPDEFFYHRRDDLFMYFHDFTERRAQWDESDLPPVEALRLAGD